MFSADVYQKLIENKPNRQKSFCKNLTRDLIGHIVISSIEKSGYKKEASQLINAKSLDATSHTGSASASIKIISNTRKNHLAKIYQVT